MRGGVALPKSKLVLEIVKHYAAQNGPLTLAELKETFPDSLLKPFGVVASLEEANPSNFSGHKRYYVDEPIMLSDGPAAVCTQWRAGSIKNLIACAEDLGYKISSTGDGC